MRATDDEPCVDCGGEDGEHYDGCGTTIDRNLAFEDPSIVGPPVSIMLDTGPTSRPKVRRAPTRHDAEDPEEPIPLPEPKRAPTAEEIEAHRIAMEFARYEPRGAPPTGEHFWRALG